MPENNDEDNTMNCKAHFDGAIPNNNKEFANTTIAYGQKDNLFEPSIFNDILTEGKYEIIDDKIMPDGLIYNYIVNTIKYTPDSLVLGNHTKIEIYLNDEKIFEEVGPKIFVLDRFRRFDEIYNLNEFSPKPVKDEDRISYTSDYIYKLAKNSYENIFELYPSDVNKRIYKEFGYENMYFSYEYLYTVGYDFLFKINNISAFDDLLIIISCV